MSVFVHRHDREWPSVDRPASPAEKAPRSLLSGCPDPDRRTYRAGYHTAIVPALIGMLGTPAHRRAEELAGAGGSEDQPEPGLLSGYTQW